MAGLSLHLGRGRCVCRHQQLNAFSRPCGSLEWVQHSGLLLGYLVAVSAVVPVRRVRGRGRVLDVGGGNQAGCFTEAHCPFEDRGCRPIGIAYVDRLGSRRGDCVGQDSDKFGV